MGEDYFVVVIPTDPKTPTVVFNGRNPISVYANAVDAAERASRQYPGALIFITKAQESYRSVVKMEKVPNVRLVA